MVKIVRGYKTGTREKRLYVLPETDGEAEILESIGLDIQRHNLEAIRTGKRDQIIPAAAQLFVCRYDDEKNPDNYACPICLRFKDLDKSKLEKRISGWIDSIEKREKSPVSLKGPDFILLPPYNKDQWSNGEVRK